jgi:hypothetical protein
MTTTSSPSLQKYVLQFIASYLLCSVAVFAVTSFMNLAVPSGMGIVTLMVSAAYPLDTFVKSEQRLMTKGERARFAFWATLSSLALSAIVILAACTYYNIGPAKVIGISGIPNWILGLLAVFGVLVSWVVIYFGSGAIGKQAMKRFEKANAK